MHESGFGDGSLRLRSWSVVKPFQKTSKIFPNWAQSSRIRITPEDADYPHFRPVPPRHGGEILFRGAEPVDLGRRAVALLCALTERPGAVVSKDALIEAAWSDVAVEESNLTVQISALRRALGGEGWIETLPRRGYRFVGPAVTPEENVGAATAAERRQLTVMSCELVGAAVPRPRSER